MEWRTLRGVALEGLAYVNVYTETPRRRWSTSVSIKSAALFFVLNLASVLETYILQSDRRDKSYPTILEIMQVIKKKKVALLYIFFPSRKSGTLAGLLSSFQLWRCLRLPRWQISSGPWDETEHTQSHQEKRSWPRVWVVWRTVAWAFTDRGNNLSTSRR